MTDEQRQAYHAKIKADSYMRWLAFYYLGRREHSQKELKQKLLAKNCNPDAVEKLLIEFAQEGYQSDERMTSALIKDGINKNHGIIRIFQTLKNTDYLLSHQPIKLTHGLKHTASFLAI